MPPAVLDQALLERYEGLLRARGVPIDGWGRPGLSELEISIALQPLGLRAPVEARAWWGWHDGETADGETHLLGPGKRAFLSLADAITTYEEYRSVVLELVEPDVPELANPEDRWDRHWLPIRGRQHPLVIDCSVTDDAPTPVRMISLEELGHKEPRALSMGEMVTWWIEALEKGAWEWNVRDGTWVKRYKEVDDKRWDIDLM